MGITARQVATLPEALWESSYRPPIVGVLQLVQPTIAHTANARHVTQAAITAHQPHQPVTFAKIIISSLMTMTSVLLPSTAPAVPPLMAAQAETSYVVQPAPATTISRCIAMSTAILASIPPITLCISTSLKTPLPT